MKMRFSLLKPSAYKLRAGFLSLLVSFIAIFTMFGCERDELASESTQLQSPSEVLAGYFPKSMMSMVPESVTAIPKSSRVVRIGLIIEDKLSPYTKYGAELAMFETNQEGGVLGLPVDILDGSDNANNLDNRLDISPPNYEVGKITGGMMGYPVALIVKDNNDNATTSAKLTEDLIKKDKVSAIIGPAYSRNALKVASVAQYYKVPLVTTESTSPGVTLVGNYIFMAASTSAFQGQAMAQFAYESLKARKADLLIQSGDPETEDLADSFKTNFVSLGGAILNIIYYLAETTDFSSQLGFIAEDAPDVVYMAGYPPEVPLAIKQARTIPQENATGITATFLGGDGWDFTELVTIGGAAVEDSYYTALYANDAPNDGNKEFIDAYQSMFGTDPEVDAAMGYDALRLIATAIRRAGSLDKLAVRNQLAATCNYRGATHILYYNDNRHPEKSIVIKRVYKGKAQFHRLVTP